MVGVGPRSSAHRFRRDHHRAKALNANHSSAGACAGVADVTLFGVLEHAVRLDRAITLDPGPAHDPDCVSWLSGDLRILLLLARGASQCLKDGVAGAGGRPYRLRHCIPLSW